VKDANETAGQKKILFITHLYYPAIGGAERVFQRIAEGLSDRGHAVTVLTSDATSTEQFFTGADNGLPGREVLNGVRIVRESIRDGGYRRFRLLDRIALRAGPLGVFYRPLVLGPHFGEAFDHILGSEFDAVIAGPVPTTAVFYGLRYRRRHPSAVSAVIPCMHTHDRLHKTRVNLRAIRSADRVLALSEHEKAFLVRRGADPEKILTIDIGVDERLLSEPKAAPGPVRDYILYLGQEGKHKRIPLLIRAMQTLWDKGSAHGLVIAGARTRFSPALDSLIAALPAGHRAKVARFNDIDEDLKIGLLDNSAALVNPSSHESFGIVFLEAWARRKPVIGAGIETIRELIRDGETGLLFEDKNALDLAAKIESLLGDPSGAAGMGEAGYQEVLARYRWEAVIKAVEAALFETRE